MRRPGAQTEIRDYKDLIVWQKGMQLAFRLSVELGFCRELAVKSLQELIIEEQKMLKSLRRSLKGERTYP